MDKLTIKNYKCFDEEGASIHDYKSINVIIGKNNSGKSSVIEIFKFLTSGDPSFFKTLRNGKIPELEFEHILSVAEVCAAMKSSSMNEKEFNLIGQGLIYTLGENRKPTLKGIRRIGLETEDSTTRQIWNHIKDTMDFPLHGKIFSHLSAERDILPEMPHDDLTVSTTGHGATRLLHKIINRENFDSAIVESILLDNINEIVNPDIRFTRILVQENERNFWEIYFESSDDGRVPLSKMGSGVKTVLLVLILLVVKPRIDGKNASEYLFALEELENNLHPSLQRRLYSFIYKFSKSNDCIFFLTTHSNIVIDLYNSLPDTQILHISKKGSRTEITSTLKETQLNTILDDLDVRASDILQSNGIIWVEGPSDRTYINCWLKILDESLIEGYHYSIMFYGGRLLSNVSFDYENLNNELIPLLKLNRNSFVVIDRDGKTIKPKLNDTKARIQDEIGQGKTWITKGREIENYISNDALKKWLKIDHGIDHTIVNELNIKLEDMIVKIGKPAEKIKYNLNKKKYSSEIVKHVVATDIETLDLKENLQNLILAIKKWNKM